MSERESQHSRKPSNRTSHATGHKPRIKNADPKKPTVGSSVKPAPKQSILQQRATPPVNAEHDFGEAVVGSENNVNQIHAPWNLGDMPAMAQFSVTGDAFRLTSRAVMTLMPSTGMKGAEVGAALEASPKIAFMPTRAGELQGTLSIRISWPMDGHVETQTIALRGRARDINQAPEQGLGSSAVTSAIAQSSDASSNKEDRSHDGSKSNRRTTVDVGLDDAIGDAKQSADDLANAQTAGIGLAENEATAYTKALPKAERSRWWDLAELALTLATGGIASHVAGLLPRLLSREVTRDVIFGSVTERITTRITPKLSESLTAAVKQGITSAGSLAIKAGLPNKNPPTPEQASPARTGGRNSSNTRINFFEDQRDLVKVERTLYREQIGEAIERLVPLMAQHPEQAETALEAVQETFAAAAARAKLLQADAVAPAWASLVARLTLGNETATTRNGASRTAAKTEKLRHHDRDGHVVAANGVLDVYIHGDHVVSARLLGVSQEIADRLADMPLVNVPLPVRFVLGTPSDANATIITRDEAGRVHVEGEIRGRDREEDNVRTASALIERFLSLPFSALNVPVEIATDDATGRGP